MIRRVRSFSTLLLVAALAPALDASTWYVSPSGSDANPGTSSASAFATLQKAANVVAPGDTAIVLPGTYAGFNLFTSGLPGQPIRFVGLAGTVLDGNNAFTGKDTVNLEGASYVVVEGFTIEGTGDPASHRAGVRVVGTSASNVAAHVTIRGNRVDRAGRWGIFSGFVDDIVIEDNETSRSADEHGIYVSNSGDRPIIRRNLVWGNHSNGIHMNGDASLGGDGVITDAVVERNVLVDNGDGNPIFGPPGGSAINCDGVTNSVIRNNLIYDNHKSGISLYRQDGGAPSTGNLVINNTVLNASDARWCMNVKDASAGNTILNNVFYNHHPSRGSIEVDSDCLPGLVSDFNAVEDRFSIDDVWIDLATWRAITQQDTSSFITTPAALFVDEASDDYHLSPTSPAVDSGTSSQAPDHDLDGDPRPSGTGFDVGAYERLQCAGDVIAYGAGLAGGGGLVPSIDVSGCPAVNSSVTLQVDDALGAAFGLLLLGVNEISLPFLGGQLLVDPVIVLPHGLAGTPGVAGAGTVQFPATIPNQPSLSGTKAAVQAVYADPNGPAGASMTAGVRVTIG